MSAFDYVPVKLFNMPLGVHLECKVYSRNEDGEMVLLCENPVLDQEMVTRFQRVMHPENNVYISRSYIMEFFKKGIFLGFSEEEARLINNDEKPWEKKRVSVNTAALKPTQPALTAAEQKILEQTRKFAEVVKKYEETKSEAEELVKNVSETGKVDREHGSKITKDIQFQIDTTDASLIIQTINRIRSADEYLHTHSLNVAFLNGLMGKWLKLEQKKQDELVEIGLLHDIGKLKISPEILNKPARLTPEEFEEIKKHPVLSLEMLIKSGVRNRTILEGTIQHHEKVNGTGYPYGLNSSKITDFARITSISDIYDAMVTKRVYKEPHSPFVILNEFSLEGYSELDINFVKIFIDCMIEELKGKQIIMSDESVATVILVNPRNLLYPIVEVDGKVITTNEEFYCKRMYNV
ncbi:MAG: HD-GYP domain-containing protein [Oscillospiraceae bacterium]|nr:HD-GYP domain-containing protein [Oscillospiraceae bacterium]